MDTFFTVLAILILAVIVLRMIVLSLKKNHEKTEVIPAAFDVPATSAQDLESNQPMQSVHVEPISQEAPLPVSKKPARKTRTPKSTPVAKKTAPKKKKNN